MVNLNPIRWKNSSTSGFSGAPPIITSLNSPPNAALNFLRIVPNMVLSITGILNAQRIERLLSMG